MKELIIKYENKIIALVNLRKDIDFELKVIERKGESAMSKDEWISLENVCIKQLDCYNEIYRDLTILNK